MSRRLTWLLLAANLLVLLWAVTGRQAEQPQRRGAGIPLERIVLVEEAARPPTPAATAESETPAADSQASPPQRQTCYRLGPFRERQVAANLLTQFLELGLTGRVVEEETDDVTGYWLMYPPAPDLATARRNLARLKARGWEDLWLFESGPWRGAISLGLYAQRSRAEAMAAKLQAQGVEVRILPRRGAVRRFWLESAQEPFPGWRASAAAAWGWSIRACAGGGNATQQ